jgi:drug/metabolite transporter (DMT)-like permease
MPSSHLVGVALALSSSMFYGSADFFGGLASRRISPYQVLALAASIGAIAMAGLALLWGESWPTLHAALFGALGGVVGTMGLIPLYQGIARGHAAIVSPVAGVIGAAIPVLFAAVTAGWPTPIQLAGFAVAIPGIWLVTLIPSTPEDKPHNGFLLGTLAGISFGFYFVIIAQVGTATVFGPLAVSKVGACLLALCLLAATRSRLPSLTGNPAAILAGVLDPVANAVFLFSTGHTRLDVAVVLASLYPMATVFLSRLVLKEHISRWQWAGVALCLTAIALITL